MKVIVFNPNGAWVAVAVVLAIGQDGQSGPLAFDPLRRPRIRQPQAKSDTSPRTWLARLRMERLQLLLPARDKTTVLDLTFNSSIPSLATVLDDPAAETRNLTNYENTLLSVVSTSLDQPLTLLQGLQWTTWIKEARVYKTAETHLRSPISAKFTGNSTAITPAELFSTFGMEPPSAADSLLVDEDGLLLQGTREVPWWEASTTLPGLFRFEIDFGAEAQHKHRLVAERSPQWSESLRRYQSAVVQATATQLDAQGLPKADTYAVGLASASLPPEISWYLENTGWVFTPGSSIFNVEFRGVAGGVAHWSPAAIQITIQGELVACTSSSPPANDHNAITYEYDVSDKNQNLRNQWTGDFNVTPDPDDLLLTLQTMSAPESQAEYDAIWLLTETGGLLLPVDRPKATSVDDIDITQRLLRGLFHLAEVSWRPVEGESGTSPLVPDFRTASQARLMLMDANQIEARFAFSIDSAGGYTCNSIQTTLHEPRLRLEDFVPLYVPPHASRSLVTMGPPPLPNFHKQGGPQSNYFSGLSFVRQSLSASTADSIAWRVHLSFSPGRSGEQPALEGDWRDTSLDIQLPPTKAANALYWFRPAGLRWIPSLPLYGDPRLDPDYRLCAERTYMPLRPQADIPITLRSGENWPVSILQKGTFYVPQVPTPPQMTCPPAFTWVAPELPGIGLVLIQDELIVIEEGRPASGSLLWLIRYELPILDELYALRALKESGKSISPKPIVQMNGPDWWRELRLLASLAQSQSNVLMEAAIAFRPGIVIAEADKSVDLRHLYAKQIFPGSASLQAIPPQASVDFALPSGERQPLIAAGQLLEGPSTRFEVDINNLDISPNLTPSGKANAPIQIKAGSLVPQVLELDDQLLVFDQLGRVSYSLPTCLGTAGLPVCHLPLIQFLPHRHRRS